MPLLIPQYQWTNQIIGFAFNLNELSSRDSMFPLVSSLLSETGDGSMLNGLWSLTPVDTILMEDNDVIDYVLQYSEGVNDFANGNSRDGLNIKPFASINTDDGFATMFISYLNLPDLNGDGSAYDVEFGFSRIDDVGQIYLNLNQDDIFDHGLGVNASYFKTNPMELMQQGDMLRQCYWGNNIDNCNVKLNLHPGKYLYMLLQGSLGGVTSNIRPTINLIPDGFGSKPVQALDSDRPNLFSTHGIDSILPSKFLGESHSSIPSNFPSIIPSSPPKVSSHSPPSSLPTDLLSQPPSYDITPQPSQITSMMTSAEPTDLLSNEPSTMIVPTISPSQMLSRRPSVMQSEEPVTEQSMNPTESPSGIVSDSPSGFGSRSPSIFVIRNPSSGPSVVPSTVPSSNESVVPSELPSSSSSRTPSSTGSRVPSSGSSVRPSSSFSNTIYPSKMQPVVLSSLPSSSIFCNSLNQILGYTFDLSDVISGPLYFSSANLLLSNTADGSMSNGLWGLTPVDRIVLTNNDTIDYRLSYSEGIDDFVHGNIRGVFTIKPFPLLISDDKFATMFISHLNLPDLSGDGSPYDISFGFSRSDDFAQVYLNLNQDDILDHGLGVNASFFDTGPMELIQQGDMLRHCFWGSTFDGCDVKLNLHPGKYLYMVLHAYVGGSRAIFRPTINLIPDGFGSKPVQAHDSDRPNLFSTCGIVGSLPSSTGW